MGTTDAKASFEIDLDAGGVEGEASSAAKALDGLRKSIAGDTQELAQMQRAMKNLQGATVVNVDQFRKLQTAIAGKKSAIAQAQGSYLDLGGSFRKAATAGTGAKSRFAELLKQTKEMPGPLGLLAKRFDEIKQKVGGGGMAVAIVGTVAALGLLVVATGKAVVALYKYGVAQADARRNELLRLQGLTKLRNYWGVAAGNAGEMQTAIDRVSASSALGREKIAAYAEQLYRMHLRGANLEAALEGVAMKASVQGEAQASMFASWAAGANMTGRSVRALADDVKARLGGVARAQMLSLGVQATKQQEAFAALFNGIDIEPLLKGKAEVNALLTQSTNSGRALKTILGLVLQPLVKTAADGQPILKRFFQGMIIGALRLTIVLLEVRNWFKRTFGSPDVLSGFDKTNAALTAGKVAVGLLGAGLAVATALAAGLAVKLTTLLVPAMWRLVASASALAVRGLVIAAPFLLAAVAIWAVINTGRLLYQLWKEIDWKDLGTSIWKGIVTGIKGGVAWVKSAISNLGDAVWKGFRSKLGIASPSKVFARLGLAIPQGVGVGVDAGTPAVRRAVVRMVPSGSLAVHAPRVRVGRSATPSVGDAARAVPTAPRLDAPHAAQSGEERVGARTSSTTNSVEIRELHVHVGGEAQPRTIAQDIKRELERILEGVAIQMGAPLPGET